MGSRGPRRGRRWGVTIIDRPFALVDQATSRRILVNLDVPPLDRALRLQKKQKDVMVIMSPPSKLTLVSGSIHSIRLAVAGGWWLMAVFDLL